MTTRTRRIALGLAAAGGLALGVGAVPAGAHVNPSPGEVPAGGSTTVTFSTGHGCDGSPTREMAIQIPEGITNASPQWLPGWDAATTMEELDEPIDSGHGEPQTERVSEITFTAQAGNELPDGTRGVFTIAFAAPETPGETLVFPVVQRCVEGETAWIEPTVEGEEEPESPAPVVTVGEAEEDGDGHGGGAAEGDEEAADGEETAAEATQPVADTSDDDDDGSDGLAIAGLVMGGLGLAAGGTALVRSRSQS